MKKLIVSIVIILFVLSAFWFYYPLRSYIVMSVYSGIHENTSVMKQNGFDINIPSNNGWYPFVMTYNADGFARYSGLDAKMSIMYNFGAFDFKTRTSSLYDKQSDKYSSFYGAYVIQQNGAAFGFDESGCLNINDLSLAVKYDYARLVIQDFGCSNPSFILNEFEISKDVSFAQTKGWTKFDAVLSANGAAHNYDGYKTPYLQYGRPMQKYNSDFEVIALYGRVYVKYLEEYDCTVMAYIIAPDLEAVDNCDTDILRDLTISPLS